MRIAYSHRSVVRLHEASYYNVVSELRSLSEQLAQRHCSVPALRSPARVESVQFQPGVVLARPRLPAPARRMTARQISGAAAIIGLRFRIVGALSPAATPSALVTTHVATVGTEARAGAVAQVEGQRVLRRSSSRVVRVESMMETYRLIGLMMAFVLVPAALAKLITFKRTAVQVAAYLGLPMRFSSALAATVISLEVLISTALISRSGETSATLAGGILFLAFSVTGRMEAHRSAKPTSRSCGCLGAGVDLRPNIASSILNLVIASSAFVSVAVEHRSRTESGSTAAWSIALSAALLAIIYWVALYSISVATRIAEIPQIVGESNVDS